MTAVERLVVMALIGLVAQLIDGALGMAYGVISSSLLLASGVAPAVASASVHMAEVVTTVVAGLSHWRFGNTSRRLVVGLGLPGAVGALAGAAFLSSLPGETIKPFVSAFLFFLGVYLLFRFTWRRERRPAQRTMRPLAVTSLGFVAGFLDATGGGGWGPITTSTLMARQADHPHKVVGSVDASEAAVALAATAGFLLTLGWEGVRLDWVAAFIAGGVVAAPLAAWLVRRLPSDLLGVLVAGVILLTNARTLLQSVGASGAVTFAAYLVIVGAWGVALGLALAQSARFREALAAEGDPLHPGEPGLRRAETP